MLKMRMIRAGGLGLLLGLLSGCLGPPADPSATQPATAIDPATTQPSYWLAQPPADTVSHPDFNRLWTACEDVCRRYQFRIERKDYRRGLLTSEGTVSAQAFELWRKDGPTSADRAEATLASIRRTFYFQFVRNADGGFTVEPRVLVERHAKVEPKLRAVTSHQTSYWYPIRRDGRMERQVAQAVRERIAELGR